MSVRVRACVCVGGWVPCRGACRCVDGRACLRVSQCGSGCVCVCVYACVCMCMLHLDLMTERKLSNIPGHKSEAVMESG